MNLRHLRLISVLWLSTQLFNSASFSSLLIDDLSLDMLFTNIFLWIFLRSIQWEAEWNWLSNSNQCIPSKTIFDSKFGNCDDPGNISILITITIEILKFIIKSNWSYVIYPSPFSEKKKTEEDKLISKFVHMSMHLIVSDVKFSRFLLKNWCCYPKKKKNKTVCVYVCSVTYIVLMVCVYIRSSFRAFGVQWCCIKRFQYTKY